MKKALVIIFILCGCFVGAVYGRSPQTTSQTELNNFTYLPIVSKPEQPPQIISFIASKETTDPGDTIELSWKTAHATQVTLYHLMSSGQLGSFWTVDATGTMTYPIPDTTRNFDRFLMYASNDTHGWVSAQVTIILNCPYPWFFANHPNICAQDVAIVSAAAMQQFEHGLMIWVGQEERIYILYDDVEYTTRWDIIRDEWEDGDPIDDPSIVPPTGYYQPIRGFGLVWRELPLVRDRLGWAVAGEEAFITAVQRTSYSKYNEIYIKTPDGKIWRLLPERSGWETIEPN
ncbi:MAG: hypothetical protein GY943_38435 [Chloroflexi bacterium]|nr:hypothetical protein [Chloroflexota bacterium]